MNITINCPYCKKVVKCAPNYTIVASLGIHYELKHRMVWDLDVLTKKLIQWGILK